jgi:anti-sigma-K factor RskA
LGTLEADEQSALEAHLNDHPQDADEARELRNAAAPLAYLAEPVAPPAELRARLLERVAQLKTSGQSGSNEAGSSSNVVPFARPRTAKDAAEGDARRINLSRSAL